MQISVEKFAYNNDTVRNAVSVINRSWRFLKFRRAFEKKVRFRQENHKDEELLEPKQTKKRGKHNKKGKI